MSKQQPLVSIIVPTYNSAATLQACLNSIAKQDYSSVELVVVDNNSTDNTKEIAKQFTKNVFNKGPERSWQRNYGVKKSTGEYVIIIDSDMELEPEVVRQCVDVYKKSSDVAGIIIPEESFGIGFWAQCKKLERSFYVGVDGIEAARCFTKKLYTELGGYDTEMVSGEDWDLSQRAAKHGELARIDAFIMHNEGHLRLGRTLKKKYYYASLAAGYLNKTDAVDSPLTANQGPIARYKLFFSQPKKLFSNPIFGFGMLFMKTAEYIFGGVGLLKRR